MKNLINFIAILSVCVFFSTCGDSASKPKTYHVSVSGNDANNGSESKPWKTFERIPMDKLKPGDTIFLAAGDLFEASWKINSLSGSKELPIVITSDAKNPATINSGDAFGLWLENSKHVKIENLHFTGSGRKSGNTQPGVYLVNCNETTVSHLDIQGYQKSGLHIHVSSDIVAGHINAHNNGFSGILVSGIYKRKDTSRNIHIHDCVATNNPGDPTVLDNHSGNGILVGNSTHVVIEFCAATENGWDMPRTGNGPVGIWAFECDDVLIQYCIAYRNKTQKGAADGGGFDFDGGVTNSIMQYNLSYENEGAAFGIFQFEGASPWYNNIVRYNISVNDGSVSAANAAIFIWNANDDPSQFRDCYIYNNTVYNKKGAAISYEPQSKHSNFHFYNNIFVVEDKFIEGTESAGTFEANNWYSFSSNRQPLKGTNNQTILPQFKNPERFEITDPRKLPFLDAFQIPGPSPMKTSGIDLKERFGWQTGDKDFNGRPALINGMGACQ